MAQNPEDISLDEIAKEQYDKAFEDLTPEQKIDVLGGAGDRVRRASPYEMVEDFRHLGVEATIYHALTIEVIDDLGNPLNGVDISIDGIVEGSTDNDGIFRITLPEGSYQLDINKTDYTAYNQTINLQSETEMTATLDYEEFRSNDPNTMYWGTGTEPTTIDSSFINGLSHSEVSSDITRQFTLDPNSEYVWYAHPARLGQIIMSQTLGDLAYEDTYQKTIKVTGDEGEEDYEIHRTPNLLDAEVTIEAKNR